MGNVRLGRQDIDKALAAALLRPARRSSTGMPALRAALSSPGSCATAPLERSVAGSGNGTGAGRETRATLPRGLAGGASVRRRTGKRQSKAAGVELPGADSVTMPALTPVSGSVNTVEAHIAVDVEGGCCSSQKDSGIRSGSTVGQTLCCSWGGDLGKESINHLNHLCCLPRQSTATETPKLHSNELSILSAHWTGRQLWTLTVLRL